MIISESFVKLSALSIRFSKGTGIDLIFMEFWTKTLIWIIKLLTALFNIFVREAWIPPDWKTSIVRQLYKKQGSRNQVNNYRPISNICTISRIFEKVIFYFLDKSVSPSLSRKQFGFKKAKSTLTNTLESYYQVFKYLDDKIPVDLITIDFSKAFDKVDLTILMNKLINFSISSQLLNILRSILFDLKQITVVDDKYSDAGIITSGVPQGSTLSPLLLKIFIHDLLQIPFTNHISAYADDLKIFGKTGIDLQKDLDLIEKWARVNHMNINENKCELIQFGSHNPCNKYQLTARLILCTRNNAYT